MLAGTAELLSAGHGADDHEHLGTKDDGVG
jgi:hypothetical protein